ncbi:pentapeptide repeat-containing protein [Trichocoleus sp. FACHB-90]|uniref:pentapeptide repeat-containing protein n=1 Tax=Cyanophyceae TaxID=3028117 RepID=UPI001684E404|nr:pentapeptide repeat-containing protein [Trichocoleus sp. FACHB-90]
MANPEHLAELNKGVKSWNQWRRENPCIIPDLAKANLSGADLSKADLSLADLSFADLRSAKFNGARFSGTRLSSANLSKVDLSNANLSKTDLRFANFSNSNLNSANLSKTDLRSANFSSSNLGKANLSGANLSEAYLRKAFLQEANLSKAVLKAAKLSFTNLSKANLSEADLSLAVMEAANLQNADLSAVQVLKTDFMRANLTGACIQDWNINSKTNLGNVQCDYVYLKKAYSFGFSSRYPKDRTFQRGEFTKQFQQTSEITELFFSNGLTEFFQSFQELQKHYTDKVMAIQELEPKNDSAIAVRLEFLPTTNKEDTKNFYEEQLQLAKVTYALQASTQMIELYKRQNTELVEIAKLQAANSINFNLEATAMSNAEGFTNNLQGANIANFANQISDKACQQANQYNYSPETKSLADAAKEIQALLDQLSQTYSTDTPVAKFALANEAIQLINGNPSLAQRILSAISAGSTSALEQFLNHPAASFFISALEDWKRNRVQ